MIQLMKLKGLNELYHSCGNLSKIKERERKGKVKGRSKKGN